MDEEIKVLNSTKEERRRKKLNIIKAQKQKMTNKKKCPIFIIIFLSIFFLIGISIYFIYKKNKNAIKYKEETEIKTDKKTDVIEETEEITQTILDLSNITNVFNYSIEYDEFDDNINEQYIQLQNYFCKNENKSINQSYEDKIKIINVSLKNINFSMYVYKSLDYISNYMMVSHYWEANHTLEILKAMQYYSQKKNLENKDIYFLDVGANIGWYTYYIGKYGYKIISFEASKINGYILYKNYCLNKDVKVTIINKGLDTEDKKCKLQVSKTNNGNGMIICENRDKSYKDFIGGEIFNNIELTRLSRYTKFLSQKNLAFMKIDVEGAEGTVIKGGKEIISKYHIPFIAMEYNIDMLKSHGVNATEFLLFLENNGYKFSLKNFFSKEYISTSELSKNYNILNLFIVHEKILE